VARRGAVVARRARAGPERRVRGRPLAPPGAAESLVDALDESAFPEIVAAAATGLGLLGPACPASARGKLRALVHADDQQVQLAAQRAAAQCGR